MELFCGKGLPNPVPAWKNCCDLDVHLTVHSFGFYRKDETSKVAKLVKKFKWVNKNGMEVEMISYGAIITSIKVPDKNGTLVDVVLGCDNITDYSKANELYLGGAIGRVCNFISRGTLRVDEDLYELSKNAVNHTYNGGFIGFDKVMWTPCRDDKKITLSYHSPDGEEGFPGDLVVNGVFYLTDKNEFVIEYRAFTTKPTYVNITNRTHFNLAGHETGPQTLYNHIVCINSDRMNETERSMPTGEILPTCGDRFDFRVPKSLKGRLIPDDEETYYDHNYIITPSEHQKNNFVAQVSHPGTGIGLEIYSNQPCVQFATANDFPDVGGTAGTPEITSWINGKGNQAYSKHSGFSMDTQNYPDVTNHEHILPEFLYPGDVYVKTLRYIFTVDNGDYLMPKSLPLISRL